MQSASYSMVGFVEPLLGTFGLYPFFWDAALVQKLKLNERGTRVIYQDTKPSEELRPELQKYVGTFADVQRTLKECSMQRALNWLELYASHYPAISDLSFILEENPEHFCAVLNCLGILIDLSIIDEFMKNIS